MERIFSTKQRQRGITFFTLRLKDRPFYGKVTTKDTPLHVAAKVGNDHAVRVFTDLAKSLDQLDACKELLRRPNNNKDTSLHYALRGGHESVVKLLIEEDPQLCDIGNAVGEHPLYLAAHQRLSDIIEPILHASSSPCFHRGPKGLTALHAAVHYSLSIRRLLQHDTSVVYDLDKEGESALHIAAFRGHVNIIKELLTSCPDAYDMINNKERTALHSAVIGGRAKVVKHILRTPNLEDVIDQQDTNGNTALHLAMLHKEYLIIVPTLARDKRVNCFATNKDHKTALDIFASTL
ncbi:ankyrin repeat-containing protein NPR4 [Eucalyptus grandis]|uniref:ankyrin repeat-containing protein NPR4 n=1 Tax=Eucalyptus grandis TaxID=71139 RepID=UPI00192E9FAF|nr:ankyrin repeat-containing protein NPR4 [Eucalyptus grandis]